MSSPEILMNLLPYRPMATGLSVYANRLLATWPESCLPLQLRLDANGKAEIEQDRSVPAGEPGPWTRQLQKLSLVQHVVPVAQLATQHELRCVYSPYTDYLWELPHVPQVLTCHDLTPLYHPNSRKAYWRSRLWLPRHLKRANRVIAISNTVADQLIAEGCSAQKIIVIYNGVDTHEAPMQAPQSLDCVVLARHSHNKNIALALEGFAQLLQDAPDWSGRLIVIGSEDRCTKRLKKLESELGISSKISWIKQLSQQKLEQQLRAALCLISPSLMEGFDYPLLEAQAIGLPTLASDVTVHRELHSSCSLLFKIGDHGQSLARQIARLDNEQGLWKQLSHAGIANAKALSLNKQMQRLLELLQEIGR